MKRCSSLALFAALAVTLTSQAIAQNPPSKKKSATRAAATGSSADSSSAKTKPATSPLPEEALKRAQQAEKQLAANNATEALSILTKLDHDFPGHASISLRLAQIYDAQDTFGPALFFYRRYSKLADNPREEAQSRLAALEVTPGARESAETFARKMGESTGPVPTPAPISKVEIAAARPDGSLVPIRSRQEAELIAKTGALPDAPPATTPAGPTPYVISDDVLEKADNIKRSQSRGAQPGGGLVLSGAGNHVSVQAGSSTPVPPSPAAANATAAAPTIPPKLAAPSTKSVYAAGVPETGGDEDAQLARAFAKGSSASQPSTNQAFPAAQITLTPAATRSAPSNTPVPSLGSGTAPAAAQSTPLPGGIAYMSPTPVSEVVSPRAREFFSVKKAAGPNATVKLYNDMADSVATIKLIPTEEGDALNAILAVNENRTLNVPPGKYDVVVDVSTTNYPPLSLLQTRFAFTFEAGTQYLRRMNAENMQQVR
jgi:hypothetical protein